MAGASNVGSGPEADRLHETIETMRNDIVPTLLNLVQMPSIGMPSVRASRSWGRYALIICSCSRETSPLSRLSNTCVSTMQTLRWASAEPNLTAAKVVAINT
jgi:hypothetical protein